MANKEESSPEEIKTYIMRKYKYQQFTTLQTSVQPFNGVTTTTSTAKPTPETTQTERKKSRTAMVLLWQNRSQEARMQSETMR